MADEISDLRLFAQIVAAGGLSAAARTLSSSPPAVSRRLAALEARLGVRLVLRSSRRFELTEEGHLLHERCLTILTQIEEAEAEASSKRAVPRGLVRVGAPSELGRRQIAPLIARFTGLFPEVQIQLLLSDAGLDVIEDGLDLALRIDMPLQAGVVATKLLASRRVVCASPAYIALHGRPETPNSLSQHDCIRLVRGRRLFDSWVFLEGGNRHEVRVDGTLSTTSGEVLHDWALEGKGVALKAFWDVRNDLETGRLIECLPLYGCDDIDLYAVYASRQHLAPRIRVVLDFIRKEMAGIA